MKKLLTILAITIFFSCDSNDEIDIFGYNYGDNVVFKIYNPQGEDLLDPATPNHMKESEMKLFYLVKGVKEEVYNGFLTHSQNFVIRKSDNEKEYHITIFLNSDVDKSGKAITYIQWNEKDTDTIEATFYESKNYIFTKEVWLNGKLVAKGTPAGGDAVAKLIK